MKNAYIIDVFKQVGRLNEQQRDGALSSEVASQLKVNALMRLKPETKLKLEREIMNAVFLEFVLGKHKPYSLKKFLDAFIYALRGWRPQRNRERCTALALRNLHNRETPAIVPQCRCRSQCDRQ